MKKLQELINSKSIIVIGITGGVGCGKSTVVHYLQDNYAASIYKADEIGHKVMEPDTKAYKTILNYFGKDILDSKSYIDRKKLSALIFDDENKLEFMNSVIHPAVEEYIINGIIEEYYNKQQHLFVIEAALLIEAGYKKISTELWYIHADKNTRIKRLMETRGYSKEKCLSIMSNQLSEEEFRKNCDFEIDNGNDLNITKNQIEKHMNFCYNYTID